MLAILSRHTMTLATLGMVALLLMACTPQPAVQPTTSPPEAPTATAQRLSVVATYSILGDLVQQVAGDRVTLTILVGAEGDPHTYQPTPRDSATIGAATLLFENGLEFEPWLDDIFVASGSQATRVVVSTGATLLATAKEGHSEEGHSEEGHSEEGHSEEGHSEEGHSEEGHSEEGHSEEGHSHGEFDPHIWQDPINAQAMVTVIRDALIAADPNNSATYTANAAAYIAELQALDSFIREQVAGLPEERRKLVTNHDTFAYFANRYGFEVIGTALGSSTESADPSAGVISELVEQIRAAAVPAIFTENTANPALMETIAREAGVTLAPALFTDALGAPGSSGATYLEMMRFNATTIVSSLAE